MKKLFLFIAIVITSFYAQSQGRLLQYSFNKVNGVTVPDETPHNYDGTLVGGAHLAINALLAGNTDSDYLDVPGAAINGLNDFSIIMEQVGTRKNHVLNNTSMNTLFSSSNANCTYCFGLAYSKPDSAWEVTMNGVLHSFQYPEMIYKSEQQVELVRENGIVTLQVDQVIVGTFNESAPVEASTFIIAQHEQCPGGCFDEDQALHGIVGKLEVWKIYHDDKLMEDNPSLEISSSVAPNPFASTATISFSSLQQSTATIALYDLAGRKVQTVFEGTVEAGDHNIELKRNELSAGVYLLQLRVNDDVRTEKIIIE